MTTAVTIAARQPANAQDGLNIKVLLNFTFTQPGHRLSEAEEQALLENLRQTLEARLSEGALVPGETRPSQVILTLEDADPEYTRVFDMAEGMGIDLSEEKIREIAEELRWSGASSDELGRQIQEAANGEHEELEEPA